MFVDIRKRLSFELLGEINEKILGLAGSAGGNPQEEPPPEDDGIAGGQAPAEDITSGSGEASHPAAIAADSEPAPQGRLLMDATVCPQDIAYSTDLNLLNDARKKSEELIDILQAGHPRAVAVCGKKHPKHAGHVGSTGHHPS